MATFTVTPSSIQHTKGGETTNVRFGGSVPQGLDYSISAAFENWVTVTLDGDNTTITTNQNSSTTGRKAIVTFYDPNDTENYVDVTITQEGDISGWSYTTGATTINWMSALLGPIIFTIPSGAGYGLCEVTSDWLRVEPRTAARTNWMVLHISNDPTNDSYSDRTAVVNIYAMNSDGDSGYIKIYLGSITYTQTGLPNALSVTPSLLSLDSGDERRPMISIVIPQNKTTNDVTLNSSCNWLEMTDVQASYTHIVRYRINIDTSTSLYSNTVYGLIEISDGSNTIYLPVERIGYGIDNLNIMPNSLVYSSLGGSEKVYIGKYISSSISVPSWMSYTEVLTGVTVGGTGKEYIFEAEQNTTGVSRSGNIIVTKDSITESIPVVQLGSSSEHFISVDPSSLEFRGNGSYDNQREAYLAVTFGSGVSSSGPGWTGVSSYDISDHMKMIGVTATSTIPSRSGSLVLSDSNVSTAVSINQNQGFYTYPSVFRLSSGEDMDSVGLVGCYDGVTPVITNSGSIPSWISSVTVTSVVSDVAGCYVSVSPNRNTAEGVSEERRFTLEFAAVLNGSTIATTSAEVRQEGGFVGLYCTPSSASFSSGGGSVAMSLSHYGSVTYDSLPEWLSLVENSASGVFQNNYTVTAASNTTDVSRSHSIVFTDDYDSVSFPVSQEAGSPGPVPVLSVVPSSLNFVSGGGSESLAVTYNGSLSYNSGEVPGWLSVLSTSVSTGYNTYSVTAASNTGETRTFGLVFTDDDTSVTVPISQDGESPVPVPISVSPSSLSFTESGGSSTVTVTSSGSVSYNALPSWITMTNSGGVYTVTAAANTGAARTHTIIFTDETGSASVVVSQEASSVISVSPSSLSFTRSGGYSYVTVTSSGTVSYSTLPDWITITNDGSVYTVTAAANTGSSRTHTITFTDGTGSATLVVSQASEYIGDRYTPIWRNITYYARPEDFPDDLAYKITINSDGYDYGTIYEGYIPFLGVSATNRFINISRLVEDWFPNITDVTHIITWASGWPGGTMIAKIYQKGDPDVLLETFYFIRDWSYYMQGYYTTKTLNDPINGHGCDNMTIPYVVFTMGDTSFSLVETSNSGSQSTRPLNTPLLPICGGLNSFYGDKKVELKGNNNTFVSYDLTYCGSGNLVYRNRFGGYDAFLIEGNIEKKEDYTRDKYNSSSVDGYYIDRGLGGDQTLDVHIKTSYTAHTGWLTDDQAERLVFHLLSSPDIYFQSFEGYRYGERHADFNLSKVVITDSSAVYKKFKNGKRMVSYAITFDLSDTKKIVY